jgi:pimeloyl-ACP methyl ester carboxylesterase
MSPTLVLVPGSFVDSEAYDPVVLPLRAKGYTIHVLDPPCYSKGYAKGKAPPSMYDDAKFVSDFVEGLGDKEVVLLAHSYGGKSNSCDFMFWQSRSGSGGGIGDRMEGRGL